MELRELQNTIGPGTAPHLRASQAPYPPICASKGLNYRYSDTLSHETRKEVNYILSSGISTWEKAMNDIEMVIRKEVKRRLRLLDELYKIGTQVETPVYEDTEEEDIERVELNREIKRQDSSIFPFPSCEVEYDDTAREHELDLYSDSGSVTETDQMSEFNEGFLSTPGDGEDVLNVSPSGVMLKDVDDLDDLSMEMDCDDDVLIF